MKIKKFHLIIELLIIIVIIVPGCIEKKPNYEYIDPGDWRVETPSIYNDKIVWEDFRNEKSNGDIYLYDLSKKEEYSIIEDNIEQTDIKIYNDKIIWRDGIVNIKMYDLNTKNIKQLSTKFWSYNPEIYDNKIIWRQDNKNGSLNIILYDVKTNKEKLIANNGSTPDIWKNLIVWNDFRNSKLSGSGIPQTMDIYLYDLSLNNEIPISTYHSFKIHPRIYENTIIWADKRNAKSDDFQYDIYMYDLLKKEEIQITKSQSVNGNYNFDIYGDIIIWTDKRNDEGDIYIYDLSKNKEIPICTNDGLQCDPAIYENKVIWKDESGIGGRFVLYEIGNEETLIFGIESTIFYISITALIIIFVIILILFIHRSKKKRRLTKLRSQKPEPGDELLEVEALESEQRTYKQQTFLCPNCKNSFVISKKKRPFSIECPHCGIKGEIK